MTVLCLALIIQTVGIVLLQLESRRHRRRASASHEAYMRQGAELVASLNEQTRLWNKLTDTLNDLADERRRHATTIRQHAGL